MPSRIEFSLIGDIPDGDAELAHSVIHETSADRKSLVARMEALGMTNVRMDSRIVPQRAGKRVTGGAG